MNFSILQSWEILDSVVAHPWETTVCALLVKYAHSNLNVWSLIEQSWASVKTAEFLPFVAFLQDLSVKTFLPDPLRTVAEVFLLLALIHLLPPSFSSSVAGALRVVG
mmetsp:Transcript_13564/g.21470  ORF Transcript_13564/g.21470 Transcript_13564/m.21470 type:complete len:107 (+) Transcript_13564:428-748(+)